MKTAEKETKDYDADPVLLLKVPKGISDKNEQQRRLRLSPIPSYWRNEKTKQCPYG